MNTIDLEVDGMTCGACVKHVTQALQGLPGVNAVVVDLAAGRASVSADAAQSGARMMAALEAAGYPARLASSSAPDSQPKSGACHGGKTGGCGCG
ncbi:heavy-metal-associated domain-containing protein [Rhodoferax sp.]|uniref:heavy-metal-associated domain-containing protein n=1 Tax=Rhodoferax sp. TaxID=50421 RepID=UPI0027646299|nr:heavy metal-associated domain-containing protein [Rhodoferax sp.]